MKSRKTQTLIQVILARNSSSDTDSDVVIKISVVTLSAGLNHLDGFKILNI